MSRRLDDAVAAYREARTRIAEARQLVDEARARAELLNAALELMQSDRATRRPS